MSRILCIGGSIANLITAHHMSSKHEVTLIDVHAEIGMPCSHPGFILELDLLKPYMTEEQMEFLKPHSNEPGWGLRSEWLNKLLALNVAEQGVNIHTRTRITSIEKKDEEFLVSFQGAGPTSKSNLVFDNIIDASTHVPPAPGALQHTFEETLPLLSPDFGVRTEWFGGTTLTTDCIELPEACWRFDRSGGLSEVWMEGTASWAPQHGWIEQISSPLSFNASQRTIDAQITEGKRLFEVVT
ncbi:MAG TPA: hypothetical protein D7H89_04330 [Candidatus Poseidoniales archaeon]|nr:MAG TPA: hypothetical protein D7H89_04330 [Candidatus Poseidoniales archaeon]HII87168.1 hypothetical protein [Candidatus Poseidoniaceae archaeon]